MKSSFEHLCPSPLPSSFWQAPGDGAQGSFRPQTTLAVVGAGGLAHPFLYTLFSAFQSPKFAPLLRNAAAPSTNYPKVRCLILDPDTVELSNLHRQILFSECDIGKQKAPQLQQALRSFFPELGASVQLEAQPLSLQRNNISDLLCGVDFVVDATDSPETKFLLNDYCIQQRIPFLYGGATESSGVILEVPANKFGTWGCLRCLFGENAEPESLRDEAAACQERGVIGPLCAEVGSLQAQYFLDYLWGPYSNIKEAPYSRLAYLRFSDKTAKERKLQRSKHCLCQNHRPRISEIDLREKECPNPFLYSKLALERIEAGNQLKLLFSSKKSQQNVKNSIAQEGHQIVQTTEKPEAGVYELTVEKL